MIVTCPSCANRYLVETERLSAQGRMVRCGNCRHTWYQPQPERIYRHLGFATDAATGLGLDIRNVTPSRGVDNGEPALLIDGMVLNTGSTPRAVPRLRAVLRDADNRPIGSWSFDSGITRLGPGESAAFHTLMRQPSDLATGVVVVFDKPPQ